jgi:membrane protein implicated in regulation of membrane protease activity
MLHIAAGVFLGLMLFALFPQFLAAAEAIGLGVTIAAVVLIAGLVAGWIGLAAVGALAIIFVLLAITRKCVDDRREASWRAALVASQEASRRGPKAYAEWARANEKLVREHGLYLP